jgi:hypothetical protein
MSPDQVARGFKMCCVSDEVDGKEDEGEVGNVGSEHESESSKCVSGQR